MAGPRHTGHARSLEVEPALRVARAAPHFGCGAHGRRHGTQRASDRSGPPDNPVSPVRRGASAGRNREHRLGSRRSAAVPGRTLGVDAGGWTPTSTRGWPSPGWYVISVRSRCAATTDEQDAAVARIIGLPHVLAEVLALVGLGGGPMGLSLAAGSYMSGSRVACTRPELVATWCDGNAPLVDSLGRRHPPAERRSRLPG